jgi:hypothetical protein
VASNDRPFPDWDAMREAPRSRIFGGRTADSVLDRLSGASLHPSDEALFTQSNVRILIGQAANSTFRFIALPTRIFPAPTGEMELGMGPGMYHRFEVAMYAGDLSYTIEQEGDAGPINLAADDRDNLTVYADDFAPLTTTRAGDLDVAVMSIAPVALDGAAAALAPAPLPGPAGAFYVLHLRNAGAARATARITLHASDLIVGHDSDAAPDVRERKRPSVDMSHGMLILTRPEGAVGVHLHGGHWARMEAPFQATRTVSLEPGEQVAIETHVVIGASSSDLLSVLFELHRRDALAWLNTTATFWRSRLGRLTVGADEPLDVVVDDELADFSRDMYVRCLFDNLNCIQTDNDGNVIAVWQGAPSDGYGMVWGIDVEPTSVSLLPLVPELTRQVMRFFATRSHVPRGGDDHSTPILVGPLIVARQWLQATGDVMSLATDPALIASLQAIVNDVLALADPSTRLVPTRYSSDGGVGRRYDYGTNVKVQYALDSFGYILRKLGRPDEAVLPEESAAAIRDGIERWMIVDGPFGAQYSGGTNLDVPPGDVYLPDGIPYYDGEDTSTMLAPPYGACEPDHQPWVNHHRFARSLWCPNYDPELDVLRWAPSEHGVFDGTGFVSRIAGSLTRAEMAEGLETLRTNGLDPVTGSLYWWPRGLEYRRGLSRCNQGQGAWAWHYLEQWLGLRVDTPDRTISVAPRGFLTRVDWEGWAAGGSRFDIAWREDESSATARITNHGDGRWHVRVGFRAGEAGAEGPIDWRTDTVGPGATVSISHERLARASDPPATGESWTRRRIADAEASAFGDTGGVVFKRFGPAVLFGHWDYDQLFEPAAMPLSVRFLVHNGTVEDWEGAFVTLQCPNGWSAQGRQARHWTRPDHLEGGIVRLDIGRIPSGNRIVAPFWLRGPGRYPVRYPWLGEAIGLHVDSQPGPGLTLITTGVTANESWLVEAELVAQAPSGEVRRRVAVPIEIRPDWDPPGPMIGRAMATALPGRQR